MGARRLGWFGAVAAAVVLLSACLTPRSASRPIKAHRPWKSPPHTIPTTTSPTISPPTTSPTTPRPTTTPLPLTVEGGFADGHTLLGRSDADLARELDGMVATGATWLRTDVDWWLTQPSGPTTYDWAPVDRVINAARARGLRVIGMIGYTPPWARPGTPTDDDKYPPADPSTYATYAAAVAARYGPQGVHVYEVWNEPNIDTFWHPAPDPAAYTTLLRAAYPAIHGADPQATVLTAGTSPANDGFGTDINPVTFLNAVYDGGGGGSFDAAAMHPSTYPDLCTTPPAGGDWRNNGCAPTVEHFHNALVAHGQADKKIWATEMGAPAPYDGMTVQFEADSITDAYGWWRSQDYVGALIWYTYRDHGTSAGNIEDHFGVVYSDFSPKEPPLSAIKEMLGD